mgnify:CR=1 FL=1
MISFESVKDYIQGLNHKEIARMIAAYLVLFIVLVGFLLYKHADAIAQAQQKMSTLNKARKDIQNILTEYEHIKSKKGEVDLELAKDKSFYIQKYYQDIMNELNITNQSPPHLVSNPGPAGYLEDSLPVNLSSITMQQLCEFLQALQANHRVFVKNLDIVKSNVPKKINVNMVIATYKPVVEKISSAK